MKMLIATIFHLLQKTQCVTCVHSCNGKNSCTIRASNSVFGDPCGGTYKYLEVAYVCECKSLKGHCAVSVF